MTETTTAPANSLPTPVPQINPDTKVFWEATGRGEFLLQRCTNCQTVIWYPRAICPECSATTLEWFPGSGKGEIYSWTKTHKGLGQYAKAGPYILAYVELEEGPRVMTNIVEYADDDLVVGKAVELVFHPTGESTALPRFRPVKS